MTTQGPQHLVRDALYDHWKKAGPHLAEYVSECAGTAFLVFCVVGVVAVMTGASSPVPHWIPPLPARLLIAGLLLGGAGWLVALSPPGRLSGAHLNPAVSLGFWLLGKMHRRDIVGYVVGQMLGAAAGALGGRWVFGALAREVHAATLRPSVSRLDAFGLELVTTFVLASVVFFCVSHEALMRWTPGAAMVASGVLVCLDGSLSGAGMNPARWFGPAWSLHFWSDAGVYTLGPLLGGSLAAALRRGLPFAHPFPHTAKLFHDPRYRSIFRHDTAPSTPPLQIP